MKRLPHISVILLVVFLLFISGAPLGAQILVQCPGDLNGDAMPDPFMLQGDGQPDLSQPNPEYDPNVTCSHISAGDGFATMADGRIQYIFSFADLTGVKDGDYGVEDGDISDDAMTAGTLAAAWPAPVIALNEGEDFYLTMTNVGMLIRPDLFDPHTVHYHGFPQASAIYDGVPDNSVSINMGASLTYYYKQAEPGTFMYHCHVEATEHMQMGMLGNLYVRPGQDRLEDTMLGSHPHTNTGDADNPPYGNFPAAEDTDLDGDGQFDEGVHDKYAYNDGDGTTRYDVDYALQLGMFDPDFHDASWTVQPLPFAMMWDRYPMINGRGYPDTKDPNPLPAPEGPACDGPCNGGIESQPESSLVTANQGDLILLRLSNLNITVSHTLISPSIPMTVVGKDARELRSTTNQPLHYTTNSVNLGGGMSADVILDTGGVDPGTYFLYAANLNHLSNYEEDYGGMMTEIKINP
jgi:FtsP/CotA-like multicopper oxidase with cupredoxin domain